MSAPTSPRTIHVGLAGLGNVGAGVCKNLDANRDLIVQRTGADIRVKRVVVRDLSRSRDVAVPSHCISTNWQDLIQDEEIQVIVELIGGTTTAYDLVCAALRAKKMSSLETKRWRSVGRSSSPWRSRPTPTSPSN